MRLLYWADQFHPYIGGLEVLTARALPRLQELGFSCAVITSKGPLNLPDEDVFGSIPVYRFPFRETLESRDPSAVQRLTRRIGELEAALAPDLVHVFLSDPSCLLHLMARRAHPSRLVVSMHNWQSMAPQAGASLLGRVLAEADWAIGNSTFTLEHLQRAEPACAPRSSVLYSGVEEPDFAPAVISFSPLRIVAIGRLVEMKGFDLAVAALARLRHELTDVRLQLIGDGPARPALEKLARGLGVDDAIEFTGWIEPDRVYAYLERASLVVVPSRWQETLCQVAIQAALMARPVVAARTGGVPEVVAHEETGLLFESGSIEALAEAVALLARAPARAREMGQAARQRALEHFTMSAYVHRLAVLYRRIVGA